ncbi:MAG: hypothetical protein ACE5EX_04265, partial [Phycisphaerae bacterium]
LVFLAGNSTIRHGPDTHRAQARRPDGMPGHGAAGRGHVCRITPTRKVRPCRARPYVFHPVLVAADSVTAPASCFRIVAIEAPRAVV